MNALIIKFGGLMTKTEKDRLKDDIIKSLENGGVIVLDDSCTYEFVNFEGGNNNGK